MGHGSQETPLPKPNGQSEGRLHISLSRWHWRESLTRLRQLVFSSTDIGCIKQNEVIDDSIFRVPYDNSSRRDERWQRSWAILQCDLCALECDGSSEFCDLNEDFNSLVYTGRTIILVTLSHIAISSGLLGFAQVNTNASGFAVINYAGDMYNYEVYLSDIKGLKSIELHVAAPGTHGEVVAVLYAAGSAKSSQVSSGLITKGSIVHTDFVGPMLLPLGQHLDPSVLQMK